MGANRDGIDAHLDDWVIVAAWLSHVAKVEDILLVYFELFEEVSHAEDFIHTRSDGIDGSGATNFVIEFGGEFFAAFDDSFAFFAIWIPGIFSLGAGFLAEGREGDLTEAVFDNFVAFLKLVGLPIAEFFGGRFDGFGDFFDLLIGEGVTVDLLPILLFYVVAIILGALCDKEMEML